MPAAQEVVALGRPAFQGQQRDEHVRALPAVVHVVPQEEEGRVNREHLSRTHAFQSFAFILHLFFPFFPLFIRSQVVSTLLKSYFMPQTSFS